MHTEAHTQQPRKVTVWAGIFECRIVRPFFIDDMFPKQKDRNLPNEIIWSQQDSVPPYFALSLRDIFLADVFLGVRLVDEEQ